MRKYLTLSNFLLFACIAISSALMVVIGIKESWWVWLSTILGVLSSKMAASGKWGMFVFDIISYVTYIYICIDANYFGEMSLSFIIILINIFCLVEWRKKQRDKVVEINTLHKVEIQFSVFVASVLIFIYAIMLSGVKSEFALLNSISTITYLLGSYYCYRRSVCQFYSWIVYEVVFIVLWTLSAVGGNWGNIIFLVGGVSELIYDIIGVLNWKKIKDKQNYDKISVKSYAMCKKMKW